MMGIRDSLEDLVVALGGERKGDSVYQLIQNIAIAVNPLVNVYLKPESMGPDYKANKIHGKLATELQDDIKVVGDNVYGTLKWATGLSEGTTTYPDGNYLGILIDIGFLPEVYAPDAQLPAGLALSYKLSSDTNWTDVPLSLDKAEEWIVLNITDNKHQKLLLRAKSNELPVFERVYYLNNLKCLKE